MASVHDINRRAFVGKSIRAAAVVPLGSLLSVRSIDSSEAQDAWIQSARNQLPVTSESVYFQTGGIGPAPRSIPRLKRLEKCVDRTADSLNRFHTGGARLLATRH